MADRITRRRLLAGAGAGALGAAALGAGLRVGAGGGEDDPDPRNVLLVVVDTLRADHVGAYGNRGVRTPNIDELAAAGTRFERMYPEAMPTVPMRRTIMTGRRIFPFNDWHPWAGVGGSPGWQPILPSRTRTLVDDFRSARYSTSYVTDNPFIGFAEAFGPFRASLDHLVTIPGHAGSERPKSSLPDRDARRVLPAHMRDNAKEVALMRDYLAQNGGAHGLDIRASQTPAGRVFEAALANLRRVGRPRRGKRPRRPFFMVVDSFDPHEPWTPPRRFRALYGDPDEPFIGNVNYGPADRLTEDELGRLGRTYKASVSHVDHQLGRLLDELERLGLAEETSVMLVSDHGVLLGERGWIGKSAWLLGPEMIHVPLIVRHPGADGGRVSDLLVSTPDVPPTLMGLAGLRPRRRFDGDDLTPVVHGDDPPGPRALAYGGYANDFFARDDRWALISDNRMAGSQLYDLRTDPGEHVDVSDDRPDVVERLRERMLARLPEPPRFYRKPEFEREPLLLEDVVGPGGTST